MLYITLGDPFSVNIESLLSLLKDIDHAVLIGSYWHFENQCHRLGSGKALNVTLCDKGEIANRISFWDIGGEKVPAEDLPSFARGQIAVESLYVLKSIMLSKSDAIMTCPIDKAACHEYGFDYPGHTEYFEALAGEKGIMLLAGDKLKVGLVTNHLPLSEVSLQVDAPMLRKKIFVLDKTLRDIYGVEKPRIAVCALNPHAGDNGAFGSEDDEVIRPTVESMTSEVDVSGPWASDTLFWKALNGQYDAVLAMYHDQGLGPLKTIHFDDAVNITGGLPFLRVSPDHGPAKDLFLKKKASPRSLKEALSIAQKYLGNNERSS